MGELSDGDGAYLIDAYAVNQRLIDRDHLEAYDVVTYGPALQQARYLHFHLRVCKLEGKTFGYRNRYWGAG